MILHHAGQPREEIDLLDPTAQEADVSPPAEADSLPPSLCPDGSPTTAWQATSSELPPGRSPLDEFLQARTEGEPPLGEDEAEQTPGGDQ